MLTDARFGKTPYGISPFGQPLVTLFCADGFEIGVTEHALVKATISSNDTLPVLLDKVVKLLTNRVKFDSLPLDTIPKTSLLEANTSGTDPPKILLTDVANIGNFIPSSDSASLYVNGVFSSLSTFIGPSESSKLGLTESAVVLVVNSSSDSPSLSLSDKAGVGGNLPLADSLLAFFSEEASIYSKGAVSDALTVSFTKSARISISSFDINNIVLSKITKITANTFDKDTFNIITGEKTGISIYGFDELIVSLSESKTTNATILKSDSGTVSLTETPYIHKPGLAIIVSYSERFTRLSIKERLARLGVKNYGG